MTDKTLVERLRIKRDPHVTWTVKADDYINPDGPEAARTIEALQARVDVLEAEALEWKAQHENLMSVRQQDLSAIQAKIDGLEKVIAFKNEAMRLTKGCRVKSS